MKVILCHERGNKGKNGTGVLHTAKLCTVKASNEMINNVRSCILNSERNEKTKLIICHELRDKEKEEKKEI